MGFEFLKVDEVLVIHRDQIERYGGALGVRDLGLLDSAIAQPAARFGGQYLHADVWEMAAAYLFHLALNHPFFDGNKRTAVAAALTFLRLNDVDFAFLEDELADFVLQVAQGNLEKPQIAAFFRAHAR